MNRHPLDLFSLVAGLLFTVLGALFVVDQLDAVAIDWRWIPAVVLLVLGAAGIIASLTRDARNRRAADELGM